jgi:RHS repeat-associated protein
LSIALTAAGCVGTEGGVGEGGGPNAIAISITNVVGRVVAKGNGGALEFRGYDARGRNIAAQHVLDGKSYVYSVGYGFPCASDACTGTASAVNGSVAISETFPDGEVVRYSFDAGGAQQATTTTPSGGVAQTIVSRVLRNARGQTIQVDYGDTASSTHHYNDATNLRLNQIETFVTASPTSILQLYTYTFDGNGNITGVSDHCAETSTGTCSSSTANTIFSAAYQYDSLNQLIRTTRNNAVFGYSYDALGNLTSKEGVSQSYFPSGVGKAHPHALSAIGSTTYAYDANGNMTGTSGAATNIALMWNANDMPVRTVYGANTTTKSFVGESMWKKVQGATTTYYLPSMRIENGANRKYFGVFAERDIGDKTGCSTNASFGCLKFYHGDHLGSSTLVTSAAGAVVHRQAYKPYGEDLVIPATGAFTPRYQFNFKEKEADGSGLYDYGARMYNPVAGRWLSADTSDADGPNRYSYVSNNPLRYEDPTGHAQNDPTVLQQLGDALVGTVTGALKWGPNWINPPIDAALRAVGINFQFGEFATSSYERSAGWGLDVATALPLGRAGFVAMKGAAAANELLTTMAVQDGGKSAARVTPVILAKGSPERETFLEIMREAGSGKKAFAHAMMSASEDAGGVEVGYSRGGKLLYGTEGKTTCNLAHTHPLTLKGKALPYRYRSTPSFTDMKTASGEGWTYIRIITRDDQGMAVMGYTRVSEDAAFKARLRDYLHLTGEW